MQKEKTLVGLLRPYRWQIGLLPFFACSVWLAIALNITGSRKEFIAISVLYALADVLIINAFVAEKARVRAFSQVLSILIFAFVFLYTYFAHREIEYAITMPLYWVAAWKRLYEELRWRWRPRLFNEGSLVLVTVLTFAAACFFFLYTDTIPTKINLAQTAGTSLFGAMLAVGNDAPAKRRSLWLVAGSIGLWIFVFACLGDVVYKYYAVRIIIATPLVAFFAALPVAIVSTREMIRIART